jgi:hypothetical protein
VSDPSAVVAERYGPPARTEAECPPRPGRGDDALAVAARRAALIDADRAYSRRRRLERGGGR